MLCSIMRRTICLLLELHWNAPLLIPKLVFSSLQLLTCFLLWLTSPLLWASAVLFLLLNVKGVSLQYIYEIIHLFFIPSLDKQLNINNLHYIDFLPGWLTLFWISVIPLIVSSIVWVFYWLFSAFNQWYDRFCRQSCLLGLSCRLSSLEWLLKSKKDMQLSRECLLYSSVIIIFGLVVPNSFCFSFILHYFRYVSTLPLCCDH